MIYKCLYLDYKTYDIRHGKANPIVIIIIIWYICKHKYTNLLVPRRAVCNVFDVCDHPGHKIH